MTNFSIERVFIIGDSDAFIAKSTCRRCGQSFQCDLRKVRLENLLNQHLAACPDIKRSEPAQKRPTARVLEFKKRAG